MYVFVLDANGVRQTSYVVGVHADTLEETEQLAQQSYPTSTIVRGNSDMQSQFLSGKIYKEGKFVDPPPYVPSDIELKEQEISELNEEFKTAEEEYLEAMRKALLLSDTSLQSEIQTDYKDLLASYTDEVARLNAELVELKGE